MRTQISENGLTKGMVQLCINDLQSWGGIVMTFDAVKEIIEKKESLLEELLEYYKHVEDDEKYGLDTGDRDLLFNSFAVNIAGKSHWPLYGDSEQYSAEFKIAVIEARKAGKIISFEDENNEAVE